MKLIILSLILTTSVLSLTTRQVVDQAEAQLDKLVDASKRLFSKTCSSTTRSCDTKVFDECSVYAPQLTCIQNFPYNKQCKAKGAFINWDNGSGRCAIGSGCDKEEDKSIICSQAGLFDEPGLKYNADSPFVYQYVGFYNSYRMIFPYQHPAFTGSNYDQCKDYDPRYRPWYVGAATGAKNMVIIIDVSGSMSKENRLESAKAAAVGVVETLGQSDWFGVIFFSDSASLFKSSLVIASDANKKEAITKINSAALVGKTNYEAAFDAAFKILKDTTDKEFGTDCGQSIFMFLTDGVPSDGIGKYESTADQATKDGAKTAFINYLTPKITAQPVTIFSYALGSSAETLIPSAIACTGKGVFDLIPDANSKSLLLTKMRSYYDYLAYGLDVKQAIWSETYKDATTEKQFITAAKPIYVINASNTKLLLGVAGVDIDLQLIEQNSDYQAVISEIQSRQRSQCTKTNLSLTDCQLNSLRDSKYQCTFTGSTNCQSFETSYNKCTTTIATSPWVNTYPQIDGKQIKYSNKDLSACCPSNDQGIDISLLKLDFYILIVCLLMLLSFIKQ